MNQPFGTARRAVGDGLGPTAGGVGRGAGLARVMTNCHIMSTEGVDMHGDHSGRGTTDQGCSASCALTFCLNTSSNVRRVDYWRATVAFALGSGRALTEFFALDAP